MDSQYYVTESDISKLFNTSGLPAKFTSQFTRDYVALKRDVSGSGNDIQSLTQRILTAENDIDSLTISYSNLTLAVNSIESDLASLTTYTDVHISSSSAHGANGNIVGRNDFCTLVNGGVVRLAAAVADQANSTVNVTTSPNAAGVAYLQADAATWVTMLNDLKTQVNALVADVNSLTSKVNTILSSERTALQRAP